MSSLVFSIHLSGSATVGLGSVTYGASSMVHYISKSLSYLTGYASVLGFNLRQLTRCRMGKIKKAA